MNIVLLRVPDSLDETFGKLKAVGSVLPPLGLAFIAAYIREHGFPAVSIVDACAENISLTAAVDRVAALNPRVLGIQTYTFNYRKVLHACELIKKQKPDIITVVGGPHPTVFPEEMLNHPMVDFAVIGEGELVFQELLDRIENGTVDFSGCKGLGWKESGRIRLNREINLVPDLSQLPLPARDLLPMHRYRPSAAKKGLKSSQIISSRGCPFDCSFCSSSWAFGRKYRTTSSERIVAEIREMQTRYGVDDIQFLDDLFLTSRLHVLEFCRLMIREKIRIPWSANARVDSVDDQLLVEMKNAGCYLLCYGVESGSERLLKIINKRTTIGQARQAIAVTKKAGILAHAMFIVALPTETEAETEATLRLAIDLNPEIVNFTPYIPLAGTALYELARQSGTIPDQPLDQLMRFDEISYIPENRTRAEIQNTIKHMYRRYYFRPGNVANMLRLIKTYPPANLFRLGSAMFSMLGSRS